MIPRIKLKKMVGEIIGTTTWRNFVHHPAPSTRAASSSSFGTPWRPARKMIIAPPPMVAQSARRMNDGITVEESVNQGKSQIPSTAHSPTLTGPSFGCNNQIQMTLNATLGVRLGRKNRVR